MRSGDVVQMQHPDGYATVTGNGQAFVGWIPNGIRGVVYLLTPDGVSAVVHFEDKLIATVAVSHLRAVPGEASASASAA